MYIKNKLLAGASILLLVGCLRHDQTSNKDHIERHENVLHTDSVKSFKTEFERVNETKSKSGKTYISVNVKDDDDIIYATEEDILNLENGIVLFGFPTCPWCRNVIEPLLDFADEENVKIHYLNVAEIRDQKELKDGIIITTYEGTKGYQAILKKFGDILDPYEGLEADSIKRILSSTVLFLNNGGFKKVKGTVESQKDPYIKLTQDQHNELKQVYKDIYTGYNWATNTH